MVTKEERIKLIQEKYDGLKSEGKLNKRNRRTSNPLDSFNYEVATQILSDQMKKGRTFVPIDLKAFWVSCGVDMDFNHNKDKVRRYFEIVMYKQLFPDNFDRIGSIYGKDTTEVLREKFQTGKHFVVESNSEIEESFLHIDVSEYTEETGE